MKTTLKHFITILLAMIATTYMYAQKVPKKDLTKKPTSGNGKVLSIPKPTLEEAKIWIADKLNRYSGISRLHDRRGEQYIYSDFRFEGSKLKYKVTSILRWDFIHSKYDRNEKECETHYSVTTDRNEYSIDFQYFRFMTKTEESKIPNYPNKAIALFTNGNNVLIDGSSQEVECDCFHETKKVNLNLFDRTVIYFDHDAETNLLQRMEKAMKDVKDYLTISEKY